MDRLRTDSPISRRIVLAFLDFLKSVEPATGVDLEGLDVIRECLEEAFKLNQSSVDDCIPPGLMIDLFSSYAKQHEFTSDVGAAAASVNTCSITSSQTAADADISEASRSEDQDPQTAEVSKDKLFGQFYAALDKINFFMTTPGGDEDHDQLAKATHFFENASMELEKSGSQKMNHGNLAETLKSEGNRAMQSKLYDKAVELYTCAIALLEKNAIYYCNRAAAYTQIHKYTEAIADCMKSIELAPDYAKAYSRLGLAYYAQGKYQEALSGFYKALQLDPNNDSVRENIRVAEQKWREESQQRGGNQNTGSSHNQQHTQSAGPRNHHSTFASIPMNVPSDFANIFMNMASTAGSSHSQEHDTQPPDPRNHGAPFTSIPMSASLPTDFTRMFMNMAAAAPSQQAPDHTPNVNAEDSSQNGIRVDANINLNFDEVPGELSGAVRSVIMDMLQQHGPSENTSGGGDGM